MQLSDTIENNFRLVPRQRVALAKLGLKTVENLLFHFPARYQELGALKRIADLAPGERATIYGVIKKIESRKTFHTRVPATDATVTDESGTLHIIWFHQPYLAKMFAEGSTVKITGHVSHTPRGFSMANPEVEAAPPEEIRRAGSMHSLFQTEHDATTQFPVYPESFGITSRWFYYALQKIFATGLLEEMEDPLPKDLLSRYHLPSLKTALRSIHAPKNDRESTVARKRFAFEEVFYIQLSKQQEKHSTEAEPSFCISKGNAQASAAEFLKRLPFAPTEAQRRAIDAILDDFEKSHAMSRLLEGDVGSGKTAVAAATAYAIVTTRPEKRAPAPTLAHPAAAIKALGDRAVDTCGSGTESQDFGNLQVAYMAPTEILAKQHFATFMELFSHLPIAIGLITSSGCKKFPSKVDPSCATTISRAQLLKWVANGEVPLLIGTHALIQKDVQFKHLAYVIIDEQHRFGTAQRRALARKGYHLPHLLSMTATPIPRTLALTIYGDLDLTLLDEMPVGRKPIHTEIVLPRDRARAYIQVREELAKGRQCYIICPRINEPDPEKELALQAKSVVEEAARLKRDIFPEYEIAIIHGKMKPKERDWVMEQFVAGTINLLVATSVVEVGVNVPNATVIVIEGAERFGLAQLHQLRGRVLRSAHQAHCFAFTESRGRSVALRLHAFKNAGSGFELAELDLKLRGAGQLGGAVQWGISDVGMEALRNIKMVEAARAEATALIARDPTLLKYPLIAKKVAARKTELHFE